MIAPSPMAPRCSVSRKYTNTAQVTPGQSAFLLKQVDGSGQYGVPGRPLVIKKGYTWGPVLKTQDVVRGKLQVPICLFEEPPDGDSAILWSSQIFSIHQFRIRPAHGLQPSR